LPIDLPPTVDEDLSTKPTVHASVRRLISLGTGPTPTRTRQLRYVRFYAYLCREADRQISKVLDALDANGLTAKTLIVRTSDHGELAMSHGRLRQKFYNAYRETLNVPLIFSNPLFFPTPQTTDAFAGLVDLLPTLATLAGVPEDARPPFKGKDLTPILTDPTASVQEYLHFTYEDDLFPVTGANCIRALVEKEWKYAVYYDPFKGAPTEYELYDLKHDPLETTNLAHFAHFKPEFAAERTRLHLRLTAVMRELGTLPDETRWPTAEEFQPLPIPRTIRHSLNPPDENRAGEAGEETSRFRRSYRAQIEINAPVHVVWQSFTDFAAFAEWNPLLTAVEPLTGDVALGAQLRVRTAALPGTLRATVTHYDSPFSLQWRDHVPFNLLTPRFGVRLEPLTGERTRFTVEESFSGPLVLLMGRQLDRRMPPLYTAMCQALQVRVTQPLNL
jgi:hypothetical protein